ncbi:MAG: hypothetical protein GF400_09160 [Candidatus Eisenbacteria bacterium]|nr:hypothetical protein [Candidatus Eisenbacteria bacterium]
MENAALMDYWGLVTRSLRLSWKHKFLWFFGFFAASSGGGNVGSWQEEGAPWLQDLFLRSPHVFVLLIMALVIVGLLLLVLNVISTGGLIRGVSEAGRERPITFSATWRAGLSTFWRLLGLTVLAILVFIVVTMVCVVPIVVSALGGPPGIAIAFVIAAVLFLPYIAFLLALTFTVTYAERQIVLRDAGVFDAVRYGWELLRARVGESFLLWLTALLSRLVFILGLIAALAVLAIPFFIIGIGNAFVALVLGIPVGVVFIILATSWFSTYLYALWTLAYERLSGYGGDVEESAWPEAVGATGDV